MKYQFGEGDPVYTHEEVSDYQIIAGTFSDSLTLFFYRLLYCLVETGPRFPRPSWIR